MCTKPNSKASSSLFKLVLREVIAHSHYSVIAVILGMLFVWLIPSGSVVTQCCHHGQGVVDKMLGHLPFHILHYAHTFFASMTATLTTTRFTKSWIKSILVGVFIPPVFCTLSDVLFPYWGGKLAGVEMSLHLCFYENMIPVAILIALGVGLGLWGSSKANSAGIVRLAASSHFLHDFVSAAASLLYLVGFGYHHWTQDLFFVFLLMLVAVVIPCILSDLVLPILICAPNDLPKDPHSQGCAYKFYEQRENKKL